MQVMEDLENVIKQARPTKPFRVLKMYDRFFDFEKKSFWVHWYKKTWYHSGFFDQNNQTTAWYCVLQKNFSDLCDWENFHVLKKGKTMKDIAAVELEILPAIVPLAPNKQKDLSTIIDYVDENNKDFFQQLLAQ